MSATYKVIRKGFLGGRKHPGQTVTFDAPLNPVPSWLEPLSGESSEFEAEVVLSPEPESNVSANAAKLAKEYSINLDDVKGTGANGQKTVTDVKNFIDKNTKPAVADEGGAGVPSELVESSSNIQVI